MLVRCCAALAIVVGLMPFPASAGIFKNAPDVIVCPAKALPERQGGLVVFYIDARAADGTLLYKQLGTATMRLRISANGVVDAPRIDGCRGKTLKELRRSGRAFDFR